MTKKYTGFEEYLKEAYVLENTSPFSFTEFEFRFWVCSLEWIDYLGYADQYAQLKYQEGLEMGLEGGYQEGVEYALNTFKS